MREKCISCTIYFFKTSFFVLNSKMADVKEECGVCGFYYENATEPVSLKYFAYDMLYEIKNRGQLSVGVCGYNPFHNSNENLLKLDLGIGEVEDFFRTDQPQQKIDFLNETLKGVAFIGHVRYATTGTSFKLSQLKREAAPMLRDHGRRQKMFSFGFNGNIANYKELRTEMLKEGYELKTNVDTELIMHLISLGLNKFAREDKNKTYLKPDLFDLFSWLMEKLDGSYSLVGIFGDGEMFALKGPEDIKPLSYGFGLDKYNRRFFAVASESNALESLGIKDFKELNGGSCVVFNGNNLVENKIYNKPHKTAHCQFEWVYFSNAESSVFNIPVDNIRYKLGENLSFLEPLKEKIRKETVSWRVVPVPMTGIPYAEAISISLGIASSQAISVKTRKRGFINRDDDRLIIMNKKYRILNSRIKDKKLLVVEDSLVRGETSKILIRKLRDAGAKEVHLRLAEPMIHHPCYYGIDFPTYDELFVNKIIKKFPNLEKKEEIEKKIAEEIGADSVFFQPILGLIQSIGLKEDSICTACLNGNYPTKFGKLRANEAYNSWKKKICLSDC
jgi:amidophosphoribosyltransferase